MTADFVDHTTKVREPADTIAWAAEGRINHARIHAGALAVVNVGAAPFRPINSQPSTINPLVLTETDRIG